MNNYREIAGRDLFFGDIIKLEEGFCKFSGKDTHHIISVMRYKAGDRILVTAGTGIIYDTELHLPGKDSLVLRILQELSFFNSLSNFTIVISSLKNREKVELIIEKCVELGFTNFVIYIAKRSQIKTINLERLNSIAISAMKQSLNPFLISISISKDLKIFRTRVSIPVIFDQFGEENMPDFEFDYSKNYVLIFGPEGGLTDEEMSLISSKKIKLTQNRLRSETAIISVASFIALSFTKKSV